MPRMSEAPKSSALAKLLLIGDGKIGKSFYAGEAASAGFNVLYLDGDVAIQTLNQLPTKALPNIYHMNVGDRLVDGSLDWRFADFLKDFTNQSKVTWNDTAQQMYRRGDESNAEIWQLRPAHMDFQTILVLDSWTSLVQSVMLWAATEAGTSLDEVERSKMRNVYQAAGEKLTQFLVVLQRIPCHVICIAHPNEFVKTEKPKGQTIGGIREGDMKVLWTKMVPKSCSNNHALTMAKFFTDVAWMESSPDGKERRLNFKLSQERISGGHWNDTKSASEYSFANLIRHIGGHVPDGLVAVDNWLQRFAVGEFSPAGNKPAPTLQIANIDSTASAAPVVVRGLGGLAGLKLKTKE